jgi:hypothetical protein
MPELTVAYAILHVADLPLMTRFYGERGLADRLAYRAYRGVWWRGDTTGVGGG